MDFPKELWHLPVGARVLVLWKTPDEGRENPVYEWADVHQKDQEETILMDLEGADFCPANYGGRYENGDYEIEAIRLPTQEEEMAIRLGVIKTYVT